MNYNELYNAINKGIPNYTIIELDNSVLLRECASDSALLTNELIKVRNEFQKNIRNICGFSKAQHYFFDSLCLYTNYKDSETTLNISAVPFIRKLKNILGVNNSSDNFNDYDLMNEMLARIEVLKKIKTPEELEKEFPLIYDDYSLSSRAYQTIKDTTDPVRKKQLWDYYNTYGFDTRFNYFMSHQCAMYRNLVVRRQFVEGYTTRNPLNLNDFKGLDKDKFELYVAFKYLEKANNSDSFDEVQDCVKYLAAYIREYKVSGNKDLSINVDGNTVSFKKVFNGYIKLFKMYKDLKPLDSERSFFKGYHINHVENHIKKHYGKCINWFVVPDGDADLFNENERNKVIEFLNRKYNYLSKDEREKVIKKRYEIYDRKIKFYDSSNYFIKLMGLNDFNGYIAYIYPNGTVILDKLFLDYGNGTPAHDEALYIMDIEYFDKMSKMDKQVLKDEPLVDRKYHSGEWESRLRKYVDRDGNDSSVEYLKEFKLKHKI